MKNEIDFRFFTDHIDTYLEFKKTEYLITLYDLIIAIYDSKDNMAIEYEEKQKSYIKKLNTIRNDILFELDTLTTIFMMISEKIKEGD